MNARKADKRARERDAARNQGRNPAHSPGRGGRAPKPCKTCGGSGSVSKWVTPRVGAKFKIDNTCPTCKGLGETY